MTKKHQAELFNRLPQNELNAIIKELLQSSSLQGAAKAIADQILKHGRDSLNSKKRNRFLREGWYGKVRVIILIAA